MLSLESTSSRMSNLARQEMYFGRFFTLDELVESIESVTAEGVQRIARTFFDTRQIALTVLGNLETFRIGRDDLACSRAQRATRSRRARPSAFGGDRPLSLVYIAALARGR